MLSNNEDCVCSTCLFESSVVCSSESLTASEGDSDSTLEMFCSSAVVDCSVLDTDASSSLFD